MIDISSSELLKQVEDTRNSLSTDRLDMSFGEIMNMYRDGEIIIAPEFQRLFRWSLYQQTRFIESLLLGIPIPPIFVAEVEKEKGKTQWEVVDGLQRISTVLSFFGLLKAPEEKNNWKLLKGDLIPDFNGLSCDDLPDKLRFGIKRSVCRIEIVKSNSEYDIRYELFNRLNTGGTMLTDQEIRNCIFRATAKDFTLFLNRQGNNPDFVELIAPTEKQKEELFLDELVLRFCALFDDDKNIKENISKHMTLFMKEMKQDQDINVYEDIINRVIQLLKPIGSKALRFQRSGFSTSLYDAIFIGIAKNIEKYENVSQDYLNDKIENLKTDEEFRTLTGSAASSETRVKKRLVIAKKIFEN